jgi:D-3-phosphoglycerate dehydrogenase
MKVLILDKISKDGIEMMKKEGIEVDLKTDFPRENIGEIIDDYEGVVVRSKTKLTREILEKTKI